MGIESGRDTRNLIYVQSAYVFGAFFGHKYKYYDSAAAAAADDDDDNNNNDNNNNNNANFYRAIKS